MRLVDPNINPAVVAVFAETSLGTHFSVAIHPDVTTPQLISKLEMEHYSCFCKVGQIKITALQVKRGCHLYHLSHSVPLRLLFKNCNTWSLHVVASQISKGEPRNKPETPWHSTAKKKEQEEKPQFKSRKCDIGNRVVRAAESLHPVSKRFKLSKLLLASDSRYRTVMANAFSFE